MARRPRLRWWITSTIEGIAPTSWVRTHAQPSRPSTHREPQRTCELSRTASKTTICCRCRSTEYLTEPRRSDEVAGALFRGVGSDNSAATADESAASAHTRTPPLRTRSATDLPVWRWKQYPKLGYSIWQGALAWWKSRSTRPSTSSSALYFASCGLTPG